MEWIDVERTADEQPVTQVSVLPTGLLFRTRSWQWGSETKRIPKKGGGYEEVSVLTAASWAVALAVVPMTPEQVKEYLHANRVDIRGEVSPLAEKVGTSVPDLQGAVQAAVEEALAKKRKTKPSRT